MRGVAYAGMLSELARNGLDFYSKRRKLMHCVGTSIGALFALMVAAGALPSELLAQARSRSLASVVGNVTMGHLVQSLHTWGLSDPADLERWVDEAVAQKLGRRHMTLGEFHRHTNVKLTVVVTNLTDNKAEYWSHENRPNERVSAAVVTSMRLPPVYPPRREEQRSRTVCGIPTTQLCSHALRIGDPIRRGAWYGKVARVTDRSVDVDVLREVLYVDGGLRDNFALSTLDLGHPPHEVLGLRVTWNCARHIDTLDKYFARLTYCGLSYIEEDKHRNMPASLQRRICACNVGDISTINFNLTPAVVTKLLHRGVQAVRVFAGARTHSVATQTA